MKAIVSGEMQTALAIQPAAVLAKATLRAAESLNLTGRQLAKVLGVSGATLSRMKTGGGTIDPESKVGECAILFVRMFRSLDALFGGTEAKSVAWFCAHNHHLGGIPSELIERVEGLVHVVEYLDAMRAKN
jgi:transcriptional regulator with XRE-family HTH domain